MDKASVAVFFYTALYLKELYYADNDHQFLDDCQNIMDFYKSEFSIMLEKRLKYLPKPAKSFAKTIKKCQTLDNVSIFSFSEAKYLPSRNSLIPECAMLGFKPTMDECKGWYIAVFQKEDKSLERHFLSPAGAGLLKSINFFVYPEYFADIFVEKKCFNNDNIVPGKVAESRIQESFECFFRTMRNATEILDRNCK